MCWQWFRWNSFRILGDTTALPLQPTGSVKPALTIMLFPLWLVLYLYAEQILYFLSLCCVSMVFFIMMQYLSDVSSSVYVSLVTEHCSSVAMQVSKYATGRQFVDVRNIPCVTVFV